MSAIERLPSLKDEPPMDEARFLKFLEARGDDERWELIDGEPVMMLHPPSLKHQIIGQNLEQRLNDALEAQGSRLFAIREVGLAIEDRPSFRPQADVAIIDEDNGDNPYFAERFYLAAEILSASNTHEYISAKRVHYAAHPDCLHILIVSQSDLAAEVWSRSNGWKGLVFRSPDDLITLPEFGFSCRLKDLYARTDLA